VYSYQITLLIGDRNHKTSTTLDERLNNDLFLLRIVFAIRDANGPFRDCSAGTRNGQKSRLCRKRRKNVMLAHIHGSVLCDIETLHNSLHNYRGGTLYESHRRPYDEAAGICRRRRFSYSTSTTGIVRSYQSFAVAADADRSRNDAWPYQCQQGQGPP
jgi:hypothetical protein